MAVNNIQRRGAPALGPKARSQAAAKQMDAVFANWKVSYRVSEAAAATGFGESTLWKRIAEGRLVAKKDGHLTIIEAAELKRFIQSLTPR